MTTNDKESPSLFSRSRAAEASRSIPTFSKIIEWFYAFVASATGRGTGATLVIVARMRKEEVFSLAIFSPVVGIHLPVGVPRQLADLQALLVKVDSSLGVLDLLALIVQSKVAV